MRSIKSRAKRVIWKQVSRLFFQPFPQETKCRQEFFYNSFRALTYNGIDGDYAEFDCAGGMTFALAYLEARRHEHQGKLWAFDSFAGLPAPQGAADSHPVWRQGAMANSIGEFHGLCASNGVPRDAYSVVPGFYQDTLTRMRPRDEPSNIALAYIDCDLYSSTKTVLQFLYPRLKHGMIIAFDDYFCWSASQVSGERRASLEVFSNESRWQLVPYVQFGWHGASFLVEDKQLLQTVVSQIAGA